MPTAERPLLVTADPLLLEEMLRIGATVGAEFDVCQELSAGRALWASASAVFVGQDALDFGRVERHEVDPRGLAAGRLPVPRREDVVIVAFEDDSTMVYQRAVDIGASSVVFLPGDETALSELLADVVEGRPTSAPVLAVVGGRGGAGASTLAAALAVTASRRGASVVLIDADPLSGGLDLVLGAEDAPGLRWPDLTGANGRVSGRALVDALPRAAGVAVLSSDRGSRLSVPAGAMAALLGAAQRGSDLVIVDLPRRLDDVGRRVLERTEAMFVVVPADLRGVAAAGRVVTQFTPCCADLRVVVRGPSPGGLSADTVAASLGLPLAGQLRQEPRLAAAGERGEAPAARGRGALAVLSARLLDACAPTARRPAA